MKFLLRLGVPFAGCLTVAVFLPMSVGRVYSQPLPSTPRPRVAERSPVSAPSIPTHVRLWKTELRSITRLRVELRTIRGAATHDLDGGGPGYLFGNYTDVSAGHGTLEVFVDADKKPLLSQPTDFSPGAFITVLLSESPQAGGPPRMEVIEDGNIIDQIPGAQITVRSFVTDLKEMRVTMGESLSAQFVVGNGFLQMRGLNPTFYPIHTVGVGADGKPFEWNNEVDLKVHRHQTLLVYPDPYGRIRPRMIVDGEGEAEQSPVSKDGQR